MIVRAATGVTFACLPPMRLRYSLEAMYLFKRSVAMAIGRRGGLRVSVYADGFFKRTPSPPPFFSMNSMPVFSSVRRIAMSFADGDVRLRVQRVLALEAQSASQPRTRQRTDPLGQRPN
jgi:hypothetical protein